MERTEREQVNYLRRLINLPHTDEAERHVQRMAEIVAEQKSKSAPASAIESWERRGIAAQNAAAEAKERDLIQAGRPELCWCLGLGSNPNREPEKFCCCPEGLAAQAHWQAERDQERALLHRQRMEKWWEESGVPSRFYHYRLETSPLAQTHPSLIEALQYPKSEPQEQIEAWLRSWFFWGQYGRGKTGLAIGYVHGAMKIGLRPLFRSVPDLLSDLRSTYGRHEGPTENDIIQKYAEVNLLVLDDLGAEQVKNQEWVADRLYQIIGHRHAEELTTVFTSNLSMAEVAERIGDRVTWRIAEMCGADHIIEIKGPNLRDIKNG